MEGLEKPAVLAFPRLMVCFGCGATLFELPEAELLQLKDGVAA